MKKAAFKQKAGLIIFGVVVFFILLEITLRIGGFVVTQIKEKEFVGEKLTSQKSDYRILCLGDSMTARGYSKWPLYLQEILNKSNTEVKFTVIEKAKSGNNSAVILSDLENYLDIYEPDMVIAMMGINDKGDTVKYKDDIFIKMVLFLQNFRVYKLIKLLWEHTFYKYEELTGRKMNKNFDKAEDYKGEEIQTMMKEGRDTTPIYRDDDIKLAQDYDRYKEYKNSESIYKKLLLENPKDISAYFDLSSLYISQKKYKEAEDVLGSGIKMNKYNEELYLSLARFYVDQNKYDEAGEILIKAAKSLKEKINKNEGNSLSIYFDLGSVYVHQKKYKRSENIIKKAIEIDPHKAEGYLSLALCYREQGRFNDAENIYRKTVQLNLDSIEPNLEFAKFYIDIGKHGDALKVLREAQEIDSTNREVKELADICRKLVKLEEVFAESPDDTNTLFQLARLYLSVDSFNQIDRLSEIIIEMPPQDNEVYLDFGVLFKSNRQYENAKLMFNKVIELDPRNHRAHIELGWCHDDLAEYEEAEMMFNNVLELAPHDVEAYARLAAVFIKKGDYKRAEEIFRRAIEVNPESERAYISLGVFYMDQVRYSEAEKLLDEARQILPDSSSIYNITSLLYNEKKGSELAKEFHDKGEDLELKYYNSQTQYNYQKLKAVILKRGIKLLCSQYPLRNVSALKKMLEPNEGIIFVSNEEPFKSAIESGTFDEYFVDNFAGDFGHCTDKGNMLLAKNIAGVILNEVFGQNYSK
ncbi:MAG: hypothetical protein DRP84_02145 [Spirochaetes bacterium]|nr:MAG: hypothetical protein DRP84_02145 [Spirochaetota bacterium]